jgi:hypothetical protein
MKRLSVFVALLFCTSFAYAQQPLNVWIKLPSVISTDGLGMVSGTTNLPDGTVLSIGLAGEPGSKFNRTDGCGMAATYVAVSHGSFGPVSITGSTCLIDSPGHYRYEIVMLAPFMQPANVIAVIGKNGSNLTGPLVKTSSMDRDIEAAIPVEVR